MCIDKSIEKEDRTCPSCRQPHNVTAATNLPVNFFLEEMFQKLAMKSIETNKINSKVAGDFREKKENIIRETKDFLYSIETGILEFQNELRIKKSLIDTHQAQLAQKLAELECLKKDIEKENKLKTGIEGTITELEKKRRFLENSVKKIQVSKNCNEVINTYENVKIKLQMSTVCQGDAKENSNIMVSKRSETYAYLQPRIEKVVKAGYVLGFSIIQSPQWDQQAPIYIETIIPGSAAQRHGGLKPGDRLLSVNGM
ncbi:unnamed protein product, partial [Meganyctiphanes norvegica]